MAKSKQEIKDEMFKVDVKTLPFNVRAEMAGKEIAPILTKYGVGVQAQVAYVDVPDETKVKSEKPIL